MKRTLSLGTLAFALSVGLASAQQPPRQPQAPAHPADHKASDKTMSSAKAGTDEHFVKEAATGGMAEVQLGKLAADKASNADVKKFGQKMADDHGKANDELKQWASSNHVTLPTELDAKAKATRDRLTKLNGAAFDKAYMHDMVMDHQHDVAAFKKESTAGKDADLKAWAAKTLPTLQDHLKMAQDTASKVGAASGGTKSKGKGK